MESLKSILKSGMGKKINSMGKDQLVILLLAGVLLIVIALPTKPKDREEEKEAGTLKGEVREQSTGESYEEFEEQRLKRALEQVAGVGRAEVMLTLAASAEKIVEREQESESQAVEESDAAGGKRTTTQARSSESVVYEEDEGGGRSPYVVQERKPKVEGVIVVAEGADDARLRQDILEAVQALFSVEAHKIKIMKMEGSK